HIVEFPGVVLDYLKRVAGNDAVVRYQALRARRAPRTRGPWWAYLSGKYSADRAASMLPRLYAERLDDSGIDVCIAHSSVGLAVMNLPDDELRPAICRAINEMNAELFSVVSDRIIPAAVISSHTPQEAIAELNHAIVTLGMKTAMINSVVVRPNAEVLKAAPHLAPHARRLYPLGLHSPYDYDPLWKRCCELKVAVGGHSKADGFGTTFDSPDNFMFNHLGVFAAGADYFCRTIFLDGVTRRFPKLNFAFLEGGVHWASALYNGLFEHWEKRNLKALKEYFDPNKLDIKLIAELFEKYGNGGLTREKFLAQPHGEVSVPDEHPAQIDEWAACKIKKKEDIRDLFVPRFYFGCEPDDRLAAIAFNPKLNHYGVKLNAMFGSDLGHWDVLDPTQVLAEAFELVEEGLLTDEDFSDFVYGNAARLHGGMNRNFYKGTRIESQINAPWTK
ncbi:MAG: amidohydrolase family protein, partial [Burkholderiales bacterium]